MTEKQRAYLFTVLGVINAVIVFKFLLGYDITLLIVLGVIGVNTFYFIKHRLLS
jgi:hypothetical protein